MSYIIKDENLTLHYTPGNGAWTYHLIIPNTKELKGKWGDLKVSGTIDGFKIEHKNLAPAKNSDKKISINATIRDAIQKTGGDTVTVTLYLENPAKKNDATEILECFKEAQVLHLFEQIEPTEQTEILDAICNVATDEQKAEKIIVAIEYLELKRM